VTPQPARPLPAAELARALGVDKPTLWRALRADPTAPGPADHDDQQRPLYDRTAVTTWWPNRRRRGRPPTPPTAQQATDHG
jgi:hypothetical protein